MAHILPIVTVPDNRLRQLAAPVESADFATPEFRALCADMITTMYEDDGIGLAAPQIGQSIRLIVVGKDALADQKDLPFSQNEDLVLVNPVIETYSWKTEIDDEGCLSVPGIGGTVERHVQVTVGAKTQTGADVTFVGKNYFARVLQHEIDHLNGILFIDRAKETWKHEHNESL